MALSTRIQKLEAALTPQGQEIFVVIEQYRCMTEGDVARERARNIRAVLGREMTDQDSIVMCLITSWAPCPTGRHTHPHRLNGGVVRRR